MINGHGGNIYELARMQGCDPDEITDMSSNVNPCGTLPGIKTHLAQRLANIESLPEADAGTITGLFADYHGVDPENVTPGNGSTQLLYVLPRALGTRKALIVGPTYADYASACRQQGITPDYLMAEEKNGLCPDLDRLASLAGRYDTVFICNPNNPTGIVTPPSALAELFKACPQTVFSVDESYLPFADETEQTSPLSYADLPNVVRMTSLSKIFKIPGLRIGFAIARADLVAKLKNYAMPWSVNSLACDAVAYILQNSDRAEHFISETRGFLAREREAIAACFKDSPHIHWFPSCTSFMLGRLKGAHTAAGVCSALADRRILIRDCTNFKGLSDKYIRVSLKGTDANQGFSDILATFLEET
ncbi:MAG: pyridoxal phosphate-dependent class II aminotransferase [Desulfobacterales bacterium]|nr:pyridoxal phosphate-dependent class II aminotransferase [Desulfobacterales bacterium]